MSATAGIPPAVVSLDKAPSPSLMARATPARLLLCLALLALGSLPEVHAFYCPAAPACICYGTTTDCNTAALTLVPSGVDPLTTTL